MAISVTLVGSNDRQLEDMLRAAAVACTSLSQSQFSSLAGAGRVPGDVAIIDIRDHPALPASLSGLRRLQPALGVVVVASSLDPTLMQEAMRASVNEFLAEPLHAAELLAAITNATAQKTESARGSVFAFVGAKGGVGTTTTAVNVATVLSRANPGRALYLDLHLAHGDAAVFLGAEPRFSVMDALENIQRMDEAYFKGLVVRTKAGPDLLASGDRPLAGGADVSRIRTLIDFASRHYRHTILDVPRSDSAALDALESVELIVVVANQELATVRSAGRIAGTLRQRYGKNRVRVIVSRYDSHAEIGHDDVERVVGSSVKHILPSDYRVALQALNVGRPIVLDNHTKLASSLKSLAHDMAGMPEADDKNERSTRLFGRLTGRRS